MDPHERSASVLVDQEDVDEAVNKSSDAQIEAEAAHERAEKAERAANETRQSKCELLEWLRKSGTIGSWTCAVGGETAADIIGASRTAGNRSNYEIQHSATELDHGA